jgi:hypothetical protein
MRIALQVEVTEEDARHASELGVTDVVLGGPECPWNTTCSRGRATSSRRAGCGWAGDARPAGCAGTCIDHGQASQKSLACLLPL